MKKAFDQTVRDIKRGVNKKVLKVPSIEQKVLDATSNEPWGPHGTHLADIAQASRNYHEYQMIMSVIWKRINDTGKNWRHVYKALTVLEYLVANGSERVTDDIREHAFQISTLSTFQYIDSNGRDQGSNVRKKSQSLVALVNDKEQIQEVRQKASANKDKFRNTAGGMYRPGSGGYDDDRYGSRDEDRNGYGGDPYGRDGGRDSDDHYGRDGYRDDEYRGRSRSVDGDYGPRSRSSYRERERPYEDDGHNSSRGSNAKADDRSQEGSVGGGHLERKFSEQNLRAPPSYEDAVGEDHNERNGETATTLGSISSSPNVTTNHQETAVSSNPAAPPSPAAAPTPAATTPAANSNKENDGFDLFDPRGPSTAAPPASGGSEMDLLGSLSDSFSSNALVLVPSTSATSVADVPTNSNPGQTFVAPSSAPAVSSQPFDDPFGDGPFRAVPSTDGFLGQPQSTPVQPQSTSGSGNNFRFGETFNDNTDILADILPPPEPTVPTQTTFQAQPGQLSTPTGFPTQAAQPGYVAQFGQPMPAEPNQTTFPSSFPGQFGQPMPPQHGFLPQQGGQSTSQPGFPPQQGGQFKPQPGFPPHQGGQFRPQPGFTAQQGGQFTPQPDFPHQQGGHFTPQPDFTAQQGGQSTSQRGFPPQQGGQFTPLLSFPPQQGGQSTPQPGFPPQQGGQSTSQPGFPAQQGGQTTPQPGFPAQQGGQPTPQPGFPPHQNGQSTSQPGFPAQMGPVSQVGFPNSNGQPAQPSNFYGGFQPQGSLAPVPPSSQVTATPPAAQYNTSNFYQQPPLTASTGALAIVPQQPAKEKFETKSTVWADTLNRGLVNLNISGSKTNPLSDIGIDFEAINRKEKRMEKPSKTPVTSNVSMGKAMGSGSGIGRAGAGALRAAPSSMVGSGMAMGAPGAGPGYGASYAGVNQPIGMNYMGQNMGMGMNMGQMQQPPAGFQPGPAMPGIYNPMMGRGGGYGPQPYGGYR